MKVLSLFSGIGGLDLGLERAGMTVVAQSEVDPYACRVLRKHWPDVPNLGDITKITEADLERVGQVELVCGGFPCQDLSVAGKQAGIRAARSGLFWELMRVVRLVGPRYVLLENVPALLARADWMGAVLGELAESGFNAEWDCIPAAAVGAPHLRDRVLIVAHRDSKGMEGFVTSGRAFSDVGEASRRDSAVSLRLWDTPWLGAAFGDCLPAPGLCRVDDRPAARVDRLRGLGNAVVSQVAEHVGRLIMEHWRQTA